MLKVDTVRAIDYWAGIPLCALGSVVDWVFRAVFRVKPTRPKNVLFIELSEMGSAILVDPALRKTKSLTGRDSYFLIFKKNRPSLFLLGTIPRENIFVIRDDGILPLFVDTFKFLIWARKKQIDTVVDLELFSRFTALLSGFCGAQNRVGFYAFHHEGLYRGSFLTHQVAYNPHIHTAKNFLALVHAFSAQEKEVPFSKVAISDEEIRLPVLRFGFEQRKPIFDRITAAFPKHDPGKHRIVLINPNASELLPQRRWQAESYARLIQEITSFDPHTVVLITGAPSESAGAEALKVASGSDRCVNFAGKTTLEELPILYDIAQFMVTNDSGPAHFASVTKMPTFVIFGPETPKLYGSLGVFIPIYADLACSPCVAATNHRKTSCKNNVCLQVITPKEVFEKVRPFLNSELQKARIESE